MDVADKVIEIIEREQHLDPGKVTIDSTFAELGIDSLDGVNILFALVAFWVLYMSGVPGLKPVVGAA